MKKYRINEIQDELTEMITKSCLSSSEMGILIAARNALNDYEKLDERVHGSNRLWGDEWEKTFNDVEKALGFELFHWQKEYIATGNRMIDGRRTGQTTASILFQLLNMVYGEPLDCSDVSDSRGMCYKKQMCDIKTKLDTVGIKTRRVWFTNEAKWAYLAAKREKELDTYEYGITQIANTLSGNLNIFIQKCLSGYGLTDIKEIANRVRIEDVSCKEPINLKYRFYIDDEYKFTIVSEREMKEFGRYVWNFKMTWEDKISSSI